MIGVLKRYGLILSPFAVKESKKIVTHKILGKNSYPEYYNSEVKRLKVKVRKARNGRILWHQYREQLKRLSKQLLLARKNVQESFLRSVLKINASAGRRSKNILFKLSAVVILPFNAI
jgi:hypothetical protein